MKGNVSGYVCNHGFPSGERDTASHRLCAMLWTQASDEEVDDVFSRRPLRPVHTGTNIGGHYSPAFFADDEPSEHANLFPDIRWRLM